MESEEAEARRLYAEAMQNSSVLFDQFTSDQIRECMDKLLPRTSVDFVDHYREEFDEMTEHEVILTGQAAVAMFGTILELRRRGG